MSIFYISPAITQQPGGSAVVVYTKDADGKLQEEVSIKSGGTRTHTTSIDDFDKLEELPDFYEKSVVVRCPACNIKGNSVTKKRPGLGMLGHMGLLCAVG